jgi:hypothetical protein
MGIMWNTQPSPIAVFHSCPALTSPIITAFAQLAACGAQVIDRATVAAIIPDAMQRPAHRLLMFTLTLPLRSTLAHLPCKPHHILISRLEFFPIHHNVPNKSMQDFKDACVIFQTLRK